MTPKLSQAAFSYTGRYSGGRRLSRPRGAAHARFWLSCRTRTHRNTHTPTRAHKRSRLLCLPGNCPLRPWRSRQVHTHAHTGTHTLTVHASLSAGQVSSDPHACFERLVHPQSSVTMRHLLDSQKATVRRCLQAKRPGLREPPALRHSGREAARPSKCRNHTRAHLTPLQLPAD